MNNRNKDLLPGLLCALLLMVTLLTPDQLTAQDASSARPENVRELFVPYEDLELLLGKDTRRVLMTRDEYEKLKSEAKTEAEIKAPLHAVLLAADYDARLFDGRATITGRLTIDVLTPGLQAIPLTFGGVGLRAAVLDGQPARLAQTGQTTDPLAATVFVEGVGTHELDVELITRLVTDAAQQRLSVQLPVGPASTLGMTVPGNVEVKSGASIISRDVDSENNRTDFKVLLSDEPVSILMSLNNRKIRDSSTVMARSVLVSEITAAYERLYATVSMQVADGAAEQFRFLISEDLEVESVAANQMSSWEVVDRDEQKELVVYLRSPVTDLSLVTIKLNRLNSGLGHWHLPFFQPQDVFGYTSVVGLLVEDRLRVAQIESDLLPIDCDILTTAIPQELLGNEPGSPALRAVAAFYSASDKMQLSASLDLPQPRFVVTSNAVFKVSDIGVEVEGGFSLFPQHEKLFFFDFNLPADWNLQRITNNDALALRYERYEEEQEERIRVFLPTGVEPFTRYTVMFQARHTPPVWATALTSETPAETTIELPGFPVADAAEQNGALAVQVVDDFEATLESSSGLVVLNGNEKPKYALGGIPTVLAYRFENAQWDASVTISRTTPRKIARVVSFFRVASESVAVHSELIFFVQQARTKSVEFSLPESTPPEISVRALDGISIKETSSSLADGRRHWKVEFAEHHSGRIRLAVEFDQQLIIEDGKDGVDQLLLPVARSHGVEYQTGAIAIEGNPELDVEILNSPREVDMGELIDADYQAGKRLLGVFGYIAEADTLLIKTARRPVHPLPTTIVERAVLVSALSPEGVCQTAARFLLKTKANYLEMRLPDGAHLWSVRLNESAALPQLEGERILIPLPLTKANAAQDLQVIYETITHPVQLRGTVELLRPELFERARRDVQGLPVPIADLRWQLSLPSGYSLVSDGAPSRRSSVLERLANSLWKIGGGFPGRSVMAARESARRLDSLVADITAEYGIDDSERAAGYGDSAAPGEFADAESVNEQLAAPSRPEEPAVKDGDLQAPASQSAQMLGGEQADQDESGAEDERGAKGMSDASLWALEGIRSLKIDIEKVESNQDSTLMSLGASPRIRITMASDQRFGWIAWVVALLVFAVGVTKKTWPPRFRYFLLVTLLSVLVPIILDWQLELERAQFSALATLAVLLTYYFFLALAQNVTHYRRSKHSGANPTKQATARSVVTSLLIVAGVVWGQQTHAQDAVPMTAGGSVVANAEQLRELLRELETTETVTIPNDAIVVPYDPNSDSSAGAAEELFVPYQAYEKLWNLAHPNAKLQTENPPAEYAWAGASYRVALDGSDSLRMIGKLTIEQFVDSSLAIPMPLQGCVLETATINGQPAKLQLVQTQRPVGVTSNAPVQRARKSDKQGRIAEPLKSFLVLHSSGAGTKEIDITLRWELSKSGGWRIASGVVPSAPASALSVTAVRENTEIRLSNPNDRTLYLTKHPNEEIESAIGADGTFSLRWRDKISEASIDQGLTVESYSTFDIQEDVQRLIFRSHLAFRRGRRQSFSFMVPADYLVENVLGENVRGWKVSATGNSRQVDVELLKEAAEREALTIVASKRSGLHNKDISSLVVPSVSVSGAMLQQGQVVIRRSILLDLRVLQAEGVSRIDQVALAPRLQELVDQAAPRPPGPLPIKDFQSYRFSQTSYQLELSAKRVEHKTTVQTQSVVKISQKETSVETRLLFQSDERPVYRIAVLLPSQFEIDPPKVSGEFQWSIRPEENASDPDAGRQLLEIYLANGQTGQFSVVLTGTVADSEIVDAQPAVIALPEIEVLQTQYQSGAIVVQADPAYEVLPQDLNGCSRALMQVSQGWLSSAQRQLARLLLTYDEVGYSGFVSVTHRTPSVKTVSVTNVKVTDRAVEETIYLEAEVSDSGIQEFVFRLPASMGQARIQCPLLRRKSATPIGDGADSSIEVHLELQDAIMGQLAIIVENDRLLTSGAQRAPIPTVVTGETTSRLVTLENASRDELVVAETVSSELVPPSQARQLRQMRSLGGESSMVYRVADATNSNVEPRLSFETKSRESLVTIGARIGLAQTELVADEYGAFRATQKYHVENRTEPFLEVQLPDSARLWTVLVAGEPVKPSSSPNTAGTLATVRIPLIKTAEGDLDYPVVLMYGGVMPAAGRLNKVSFPLVKSVNISVERSHVRLRLPENIRWFNFTGTMGRVRGESELMADWLAYRTRQISELASLLGKSGKGYSKIRASNNLKQLDTEILEYREQNKYELSSTQGELRSQLEANSAALGIAKQEIDGFETEEGEAHQRFSNRSRLYRLFGEQTNGRSTNVLQGLGDNFPSSQPSVKEREPKSSAPTSSTYFNESWFAASQLSNKDSTIATASKLGKGLEQDRQRLLRRRASQLDEVDKKIVPRFNRQYFGDTEATTFSSEVAGQMLGEFQQQANLYNERLQRETTRDSASRLQISGSGSSNGSEPAIPTLGIQLDSKSKSLQQSASISGRWQAGAELSNSSETALLEPPSAAFDFFATDGNQFGQARSNHPAVLATAGRVRRRDLSSVSRGEAFLASLQVDLTVRGQELLFTSTGGDLELSALSVSNSFVDKSLSVLAVLVIAVVATICYRCLRLMTKRVSRKRILASILGFAGCISLIGGILPVFGLLLLLSSAVVGFTRQEGVS